MPAKIDSVSARDRLKPRREPYWHRVSKGCYVGFRRMTTATPGNWWARYRDAESGKQMAHGLGGLEDLAPTARFDQAVKLAREWFSHLGMGGSTGTFTVRDACDAYVKHIRTIKADGPADDLEARYRRWVHEDPIGKVELIKLLPSHVEAFMDRMMAAPVKVGKSGETRKRSKDSINRDMAAVRAAMNHAKAKRKVTSDFAWSEGLKAIPDAGNPRQLYLDRDQRRRFLAHSAADLEHFLRGLTLLPLRPGALAALSAGDFDKRLGVLKIGNDKHGKDRKLKLPVETAAFFEAMAKDKLPAAPMLCRADGKRWDKDAWKGPVKEAAAAANADAPVKHRIPDGATAYTLRHSTISDLVHGGLDLLTVAQLAGTSVAMIERTYGHLRGEVAASALAKLAL
jgi:integrase